MAPLVPHWRTKSSLSSSDSSVDATALDEVSDADVGDLSPLVEQFRRGVRNVLMLRRRLKRLANASDGLRDALFSVSCGALEDAGGWPKKPTATEISLVNADEHSILARVARASDEPYAELERLASHIEKALGIREQLVGYYITRRRELARVSEKQARARDPHALDFEVAVAGTEYMRSADRAYQSASRLEQAMVAFEKALAAEERATALALAAARIVHAERATACLRPLVEQHMLDLLKATDDTTILERFLNRCRRSQQLDEEVKTETDISHEASFALPQTATLRACVEDLAGLRQGTGARHHHSVEQTPVTQPHTDSTPSKPAQLHLADQPSFESTQPSDAEWHSPNSDDYEDDSFKNIQSALAALSPTAAAALNIRLKQRFSDCDEPVANDLQHVQAATSVSHVQPSTDVESIRASHDSEPYSPSNDVDLDAIIET